MCVCVCVRAAEKMYGLYSHVDGNSSYVIGFGCVYNLVCVYKGLDVCII